MKRVLCIAECCCDMIFTGLPHLPAPGEEVYGRDFAVRPGGGANTPISLGYLGVPVTFLTRLGSDVPGTIVREGLLAAGVETVGQIGGPEIRTAVSAVLSTAQDRSFASYGGQGQSVFDPAQMEEAIRRAEIVHTYLGYCQTYPIAALCERYGKTLSLDCSCADADPSGKWKDALLCCDYLKVNQAEAACLTGLTDPYEALRTLSRMVRKGAAVTLGKDGSIGMEAVSGSLLRCRPFEFGNCVDSCGAGDAYSAGMLYALSDGRAWPAVLEAGSRASAAAVTWPGGTHPSIVDYF